MDNEKRFYLRVGQNLEEVSEEIYKEYYKIQRRERYLEERDLAHGRFLYSQFDNVYEDILGEELLKDSTREDVCDFVVKKVMVEKLRKSLRLLSDEELELIIHLFYQEKSQRQISREISIPVMTINSRKDRILKKLKKYLGN
ncbi:MAG TPA: sigma factor-like helix-turn-helix DNA-binding protein [Pseudobacteroides sp.]|uniref:sigma factor-like helix-turn-helix DNA-binding protein n=1 Tax=Pseudobacteroides sp. TaxID=1968840 RepID=UPI002F952EAE